MTRRELQELAALMGAEATEVDAYYMARLMRRRGWDPALASSVPTIIWLNMLNESKDEMRKEVLGMIRAAAERYGREVLTGDLMSLIEHSLNPLEKWRRLLERAVAPTSDSCLAAHSWGVFEDPDHLQENIEWWTRAYAALYTANRSDDARATEEVCEAIAHGNLDGAEALVGLEVG